jgi:phosphatidylglycerophosphate synthase
MDQTPSPLSLCLVGTSPLRVWGLTAYDRVRRIAARLGAAAVDEPRAVAAQARVLFMRADVLVEERLMQALLKRPGSVLMAGTPERTVAACADPGHHAEAVELLNGGRAAGWLALRAGDPELGFDTVLRKRETPYVLDLTREGLRAVEWRLFGASYKGATDFITKWVWPWPAFHATRACAALRLSPNTVTAASFVLVLLATWLFAEGHFALGLLAAWPMTFLDTVDGKLARVTVTSSKWGNIFDHGIDLVHPPFWYWAWWMGLDDDSAAMTAALIVVIGGYVLGRMLEGAFIALFKFEMHIWRRFDYLFRAITARRNPNLFLLTLSVIAGRPDLGFLAVAVWTVISLLVHTLRLAQAAARKETVRPFLDEVAA